jgi:hypothetical protein
MYVRSHGNWSRIAWDSTSTLLGTTVYFMECLKHKIDSNQPRRLMWRYCAWYVFGMRPVLTLSWFSSACLTKYSLFRPCCLPSNSLSDHELPVILLSDANSVVHYTTNRLLLMCRGTRGNSYNGFFNVVADTSISLKCKSGSFVQQNFS